jgi:hypothetical protein
VEESMTSQSDERDSNVPAAEALASLNESDKDDATDAVTRDDGVPVGAADRDADIERSGGEAADEPASEAEEWGFGTDLDRQTDGGVPVGRADAEADRLRAAQQSDDG